jgi:hypothetical protein
VWSFGGMIIVTEEHMYHSWKCSHVFFFSCVGHKTRERDCWGDTGIDGRIILGWIFRKWDVGVWTGLGWLRIGTGGGRL